MAEPSSAAAPTGMAGQWTLRQGDGAPCRLILSGETAEPRAAGSLPPPMQGARLEGDCALARPVGGWRETGGGLELVDAYGQTITTLSPDGDGGFSGGGLTVVRP